MPRPTPHPKSNPATAFPSLLGVVRELSKRPPPPNRQFVPFPSAIHNPPPAPPTPPPAATLASSGGKKKKKKNKNGGGPAAATLLFKDDNCLVCNDAFPKAQIHALIMPLDTRLRSLNDLNMTHLPLLKHMYSVSCSYAQFLRSTSHPKLRMVSGFHSLPSLPMLHMHLISMDLQSDRLKNKKHYNSFTTNFFLTAPRVIADLETNGYITINQQVDELHALETQQLKCVWCGEVFEGKPIAELKAHMKMCPRNASYDH